MSLSRLIKPLFLANAFEFYELSIYGYLSGILGKLFFQADHPALAVAKSFSVFAIGYLARPFGGIFFGLLSDRISRAYSLKLSLAVMACATFLIGLLPTYDQVGSLATIGLLLARFMQSFSAGGELMGSSCYAFEKSSFNTRGLSCSVVTASSAFGFLLGSLTATILCLLFNESDRLAWAWRIPFLISFPLALGIYLIRKNFQNDDGPKNTSSITYSDYRLIRRQFLMLKYPFIKALILSAYWEVAVYTLKIWMPAYLIYFLNVSAPVAQIANTLSLLLGALLTLCIGYVSDKFGYSRVLLASVVLLIVGVYPLFRYLPSHSWWLIFSLQALSASIVAMLSGSMVPALGELFPSDWRGRMMHLSHAIANVVCGVTAPAVCSYMIHHTGIIDFPILYVIGFSLLALFVIFTLPKVFQLKEITP